MKEQLPKITDLLLNQVRRSRGEMLKSVSRKAGSMGSRFSRYLGPLFAVAAFVVKKGYDLWAYDMRVAQERFPCCFRQWQRQPQQLQSLLHYLWDEVYHHYLQPQQQQEYLQQAEAGALRSAHRLTIGDRTIPFEPVESFLSRGPLPQRIGRVNRFNFSPEGIFYRSHKGAVAAGIDLFLRSSDYENQNYMALQRRLFHILAKIILTPDNPLDCAMLLQQERRRRRRADDRLHLRKHAQRLLWNKVFKRYEGRLAATIYRLFSPGYSKMVEKALTLAPWTLDNRDLLWQAGRVEYRSLPYCLADSVLSFHQAIAAEEVLAISPLKLRQRQAMAIEHTDLLFTLFNHYPETQGSPFFGESLHPLRTALMLDHRLAQALKRVVEQSQPTTTTPRLLRLFQPRPAFSMAQLLARMEKIYQQRSLYLEAAIIGETEAALAQFDIIQTIEEKVGDLRQLFFHPKIRSWTP
ncbi:MAG: hypothetical protein HQL48_03045 [Gammaproteobacteria bacterium]|nr:hypothetical protein [Gammaproteobacteria bacterium]